MIKFKADGANGRTLVGLGMTERNVEQLKAGNPIYIIGIEMGLPVDITIFYGETEEAIYAELRKAGLIHPEKTVIHDEVKKTRQ